jgi:shikimate kinase
MKNIIFIGMPGSGKSTLGVVLAKKLGYSFIDSDLVIQEKYGTTLERIIEKYGDDGFIKIENDVNCTINAEHAVIATGGSAVYGETAMEHFKDIGTVIYLEVDELMTHEVTEEENEKLAQIRSEALDIDPLYSIFTSGSTGVPKGVIVNHRSVIDFIDCLLTQLYTFLHRRSRP